MVPVALRGKVVKPQPEHRVGAAGGERRTFKH